MEYLLGESAVVCQQEAKSDEGRGKNEVVDLDWATLPFSEFACARIAMLYPMEGCKSLAN